MDFSWIPAFAGMTKGGVFRLLRGHQTKSPLVSQEAFCFKGSRRRPTLPRSSPRSTIGAEELNFRVRDGNGCFLLAIATENYIKVKNTGSTFPARGKENYGQASRPIRTG